MLVSQLSKPIPKTLLGRTIKWRENVAEQEQQWIPNFLKEQKRDSRCVACGNNSRIVGKVKDVPFQECSNCRHVSSTISPSEEFLSAYYSHESSLQVEAYVNLNEESLQDRSDNIGGPKVEFIHRTIGLGPNGRETQSRLWIDIGCGVGDLLLSAKTLGYECLGIEPDRRQARVATSRNLDVVNLFLGEKVDDYQILQRGDVITLINVLEHVDNPKSFLKKIANSMRKNSYFCFEAPRHPSLSSIVQLANVSRVNRHLNPPEHLHVFSEESARLMLEEVGLEVCAIWTFGSDSLEVFQSVGENLKWKKAFDSEELEARINRLQSEIDVQGLSDSMLIVSRKK